MKRIDCVYNLDDLMLSKNEETPPEVVLWRAVIMQQLLDAGNNSELRFMKQLKKDAIAWLSGTGRDFHEVCALANLDPSYVKKRASLALKRRCLWRKYNKNSYIGRNKKK